jgi:hypothetical protein
MHEERLSNKTTHVDGYAPWRTTPVVSGLLLVWHKPNSEQWDDDVLRVRQFF